jgi:signal transduction histidine kinase
VTAAQERIGHSDPDRLPQLWGRVGFWQIRLRWAVAPLMIAGVIAARALGFEFRALPILLIAIASPLYNAVFAWVFKRYATRFATDPRLDLVVTQLEVTADYTLMFLLIYFTGGTSSPLVVFFLFHVIIAAIQFDRRTAFQFAALAAAGLWLLFIGETTGWIPCESVAFRGQPVHVLDRPVYSAAMLAAFTSTLFIAAAMVTRIMRGFRTRVGELARVTAELSQLNDKLSSLYAMVATIGAERQLEPMLDTVTSELASVMSASGVAVKLLSSDGTSLRYVSAVGLPDSVTSAVINLDQSPLNRRVMQGETLVHGRPGADTLQLRTELQAIGIESAVMAPLRVEDRVIGTLGVYSQDQEFFDAADTDFLKLVADLVAIAIEDARANEAVESLMQERTNFMLQVAHNLRAPLSAALSMMDLISGGYLGAVTDEQVENLNRIEDRLRSLHQTVGDLLTIARTRDWSREIPDVVVSLTDLARHTEETFEGEAERKNIRFSVVAPAALPNVDSGTDLLEQVMENLVSNAIKYTPMNGEVEVRFERHGADEIRISVRDTGIGIPADEQDRLFDEFFRASNAKRLTASGTGLGLALVRQTVERHSGRMHLSSAEGEGTTVLVELPIRQAGRSGGREQQS